MKKEVLSLGYRSNGRRPSVWNTGRIEQGVFQYIVTVEWNREDFTLMYVSSGTGRSSVWVTGRMEQGNL